MKADRVLDHRDLVKLPSFRIRTDERNSCCAHIAGRMKVHGFLAPQTNNKEKERKPTETHEETTRASSSQYAPKPT